MRVIRIAGCNLLLAALFMTLSLLGYDAKVYAWQDWKADNPGLEQERE